MGGSGKGGGNKEIKVSQLGKVKGWVEWWEKGRGYVGRVCFLSWVMMKLQLSSSGNLFKVQCSYVTHRSERQSSLGVPRLDRKRDRYIR